MCFSINKRETTPINRQYLFPIPVELEEVPCVPHDIAVNVVFVAFLVQLGVEHEQDNVDASVPQGG